VHKLKPILTGRIIAAFTILVLGLGIIFSLNSGKNRIPNPLENETYLKIGEVKIKTEIANTDEELTQGLSGRVSLEKNTGMYFVLGERRIATFWMKGMLFPLDIIWIDQDVVVGIDKNAPIPTTKRIPSFTSPAPVTHVLEVNADFTTENNIKVGDLLETL